MTNRSSCAAALILTLAWSLGAPPAAGSQEPAALKSSERARSAPPASDLPPLPDGAEALTPMRFRVVWAWAQTGGGQLKMTQIVTRTIDRAQLLVEGGRKEWLFERNPKDGRRVSGYLVAHADRRIVVHDESDLRNTQQIRGWSDVLTLRVDPRTLVAFKTTGERQSMTGVDFARHVNPDPSARGLAEVWWSPALLLPLRMTIKEPSAVVTVSVDDIAPASDLRALSDPRARFPDYRVLDVSDVAER